MARARATLSATWGKRRTNRSGAIVRGERDDAAETGAPRAECERPGPALAHTGDDDRAGAAAGQPRDRRFELSRALRKRPVTHAPMRPAHLGPLDQIPRVLHCRREQGGG